MAAIVPCNSFGRGLDSNLVCFVCGDGKSDMRLDMIVVGVQNSSPEVNDYHDKMERIIRDVFHNEKCKRHPYSDKRLEVGACKLHFSNLKLLHETINSQGGISEEILNQCK